MVIPIRISLLDRSMDRLYNLVDFYTTKFIIDHWYHSYVIHMITILSICLLDSSSSKNLITTPKPTCPNAIEILLHLPMACWYLSSRLTSCPMLKVSSPKSTLALWLRTVPLLCTNDLHWTNMYLDQILLRGRKKMEFQHLYSYYGYQLVDWDSYDFNLPLYLNHQQLPQSNHSLVFQMLSDHYLKLSFLLLDVTYWKPWR